MVVIVRICVRKLLLSVMEWRIVVANQLIPKGVYQVVPLMVAVLIILERVVLLIVMK